MVLTATIGVAVWWSRQSAQPAFTSATIDVQALTLDGHAGDAAISPDGKFIAYLRVDGIKNSVWVKQIASNSDIEILPHVRGRFYCAPSVTPDGNYVDVISAEPQWQTAVYRLPFLGGTPRVLLRGITSGIGWSPDGRHLAFVRVTVDGSATSLVIADPDGANERVVASRRPPDMFVNIFYSGQPPNRPSWSLDGRTIGLVGASMDAARLDAGELIEIDVQSGVERQVRRLGIRTWGIEMAFLSNGRVLVSEAGENTAPSLRIWESRAVAGTPLTRDLASFRNISLTADRSSGVATRTVARSGIWIGPVSGGDFRQLISEGPDRPGNGALDAAGNLFYQVTMPSGHQAVFRRAKDSGSSTLVLDDAANPFVSADGRQLFVARSTASPGLYRLDVDGTNLTLLVEDASVGYPVITPDGHNVLYMSNKQGTQEPWMVPTSGGAARRLAPVFVTSSMAVSPDGARVLFTGAGGSGSATRLCDFPSFKNCRDTPVWPGAWLADNRTIIFGDPTYSNLVSQSVDGGPVRQITRFTDQRPGGFALSPDRRTIVLTRRVASSDVVLITALNR
jgi:Tol biopolymer transport system component